MEIITGNKALETIAAPAFQARWTALYDDCAWATGCQHPDFVLPWYQIYGQRHLPVVVVEEGPGGALTGLLTLALSEDRTRLTGAGAQQAEYQGWITASDAAETFMPEAIARLQAVFAGASIALRYLPPGIPLDWMRHSPGLMKCSAMWTHTRPVMRIDEAAMEYQRRKKNHRQNFNRLQKLGEVHFERVTDHERFTQLFDDICMQYDFRQAGLHRHMPFASDPLKKRFYLELHKRQMLHATVLTVDREIAASHLGMLSKGRAVHLGINTHAPAFAAHSPGNLLLAMLGVLLAREQVKLFDLTPGGDGYKENFASDHDEVFELTVYGNPMKRMRAEALAGARRLSKASLNAMGLRSADLRAALDKARSLARPEPQRLLERMPFAARRGLWVRRATAETREAAPAPLPIGRNRLADVFHYDGDGSPLRRRAFLGTAMKRLERSCRLYSYAEQDRLMISCWAETGEAQAAAHTDNAESAAFLFDLYVHRQLGDRQLVKRFIDDLVADLGRTSGAGCIYYRGALSSPLQAVVKECGFSEA